MLTVILAFVVGVLPLLVLLLTGGAALVGAPEAGAAEAAEPGLSLLLVPITMLACLYAALRLQLIFPATAIGDRHDAGPLLGDDRAAMAGGCSAGSAWPRLPVGRGGDRPDPAPGLGRRRHRQHRAAARWPTSPPSATPGCRRR